MDTGVLAGSGTLLVASGLWALYTVGLREVELDPVGSIGLLCLPSFAAVGLLVLTGVLPSGMAHAAGSDILLFLVVQGLGVGLCAGLLYAYAIRRLGAERSAVVAASARWPSCCWPSPSSASRDRRRARRRPSHHRRRGPRQPPAPPPTRGSRTCLSSCPRRPPTRCGT